MKVSWKGGGAYESKYCTLQKGKAFLSAYETIKVILGFGMFTIALITLMVKLLKNDEKK